METSLRGESFQETSPIKVADCKQLEGNEKRSSELNYDSTEEAIYIRHIKFEMNSRTEDRNNVRVSRLLSVTEVGLLS